VLEVSEIITYFAVQSSEGDAIRQKYQGCGTRYRDPAKVLHLLRGFAFCVPDAWWEETAKYTPHHKHKRPTQGGIEGAARKT